MTRAAPHLWQRLRRRWALACLRARHAQLIEAITHIERGVDADLAVLGALRTELQLVQLRLRASARPAPAAPITWGL